MTGLFGSTVLEVAIGLALLYLLLAIFCTTANEWIAGVLKTRGKLLAKALKQMLDGQPMAAGDTNTLALLNKFYEHPLVNSAGGEGKFSYLSPRTFSKALMDLATPLQQGVITFQQLEDGIKAMPDGDVKKTLLALIENSNRDLQQAQKAIEGWYDDIMDRVSGWYKRKTQLVTLVVASAITIAVNADTLYIAKRLWVEPALRSAMTESAKARGAAAAGASQAPSKDETAELGQVLGWTGNEDWGTGGTFQRLVGWILTVLAISMGAPFWFDLLNKVTNLRASGKPPASGGESTAPA